MSTVLVSPGNVGTLDALEARQRRVWAAGDYAVIGTTLHIVGEQLCETMNLAAGSIDIVSRQFVFRYLSTEHFIEVFRTWYGPIHQAFISSGERAPALAADLRELLERCNEARDGSLAVPSAYIDVVIRRA